MDWPGVMNSTAPLAARPMRPIGVMKRGQPAGEITSWRTTRTVSPTPRSLRTPTPRTAPRSASLPSTRHPATLTTARWAAILRLGSIARPSKPPNTVTWWPGCACPTAKASGPPIGCWEPISPLWAGPLAVRSTSWKISATPPNCRSIMGRCMMALISPIFGPAPPNPSTPNTMSTAPSGWPTGSIFSWTVIITSPSLAPTKRPALGNSTTPFTTSWMWR